MKSQLLKRAEDNVWQKMFHMTDVLVIDRLVKSALSGNVSLVESL